MERYERVDLKNGQDHHLTPSGDRDMMCYKSMGTIAHAEGKGLSTMKGGCAYLLKFRKSEIWGALIFEDFSTMEGGGCVY